MYAHVRVPGRPGICARFPRCFHHYITIRGDPYCGGRSRLSGTDDYMTRENRTYKRDEWHKWDKYRYSSHPDQGVTSNVAFGDSNFASRNAERPKTPVFERSGTQKHVESGGGVTCNQIS